MAVQHAWVPHGWRGTGAGEEKCIPTLPATITITVAVTVTVIPGPAGRYPHKGGHNRGVSREGEGTGQDTQTHRHTHKAGHANCAPSPIPARVPIIPAAGAHKRKHACAMGRRVRVREKGQRHKDNNDNHKDN